MILAIFAALSLAVAVVLAWPLLQAREARRAGVLVAMLMFGSGALYLALGRPDLPDAPFAARARAPDFAMKQEAWALAKRLEHDPSPAGYSRLGELMVDLAGGRVSPEAGEAFARALERDPRDPRARFYAGLALRQRGQTQQALAVWRALEADSQPDAPWMGMLKAEIAKAEKSPPPR